MYKHVVKYEDFLGNSKSAVLYFNISKSRAQRMFLEESTVTQVTDENGKVSSEVIHDGLSARIKRTVEYGTGKEILDLFDWILRNSYGEIADDGESFVQSDELYEKWTCSASYDALMSEFMENPNILDKFVKSVFPKEMLKNIDDGKKDLQERYLDRAAKRGELSD